MRTARFAIINDDEMEVGLIRQGILRASGGRWECQIYSEDDLMAIWGGLRDFVFLDISCLSMDYSEDLHHSYQRLARYMNQHYSNKVVITTRLSEFFLRETKEGIEGLLERPEKLLFLPSLSGDRLSDVILNNLPMHLSEHDPNAQLSRRRAFDN